MSLFSRQKEYNVSINQEDWVTPEETLLDSSSSYSDLEMPIPRGTFRVAEVLLALLTIGVLFFTFRMSVTRNEYFSSLAVRNRTINFSVPPPRGLILDRLERPLLENVPSFDFLVVTRELTKTPQEYRVAVQAVAPVLQITEDELKNLITENSKKSSVFFVATDLDKQQVLKLLKLSAKGFYVVTSTKRHYLDGSQFSSILGYVGKVNKEDLKDDPYYLPSDLIGRLGAESSYEEELRGTHGQIVFVKKGESENQDPVIGNSVVLNIDADLQKKLYNTLFGILREAKLSGAAAVIQNPKTGAVLAMTSFPDFDPNLFTREVSTTDAKRLFESRYRPLFNRAISGLYNPGSTIKPFIGLAALQEKVIRPGDTIRDCISITIPNPSKPDEPYIFKNWRADVGLFNLRRAIADSCNIFFFTVGGGFGNIGGLGAEKIAKYLGLAKANTLLGIDLPGEAQGFVPTPDWKIKTRGEPWYQGDTYNISIGQGDLLVTPLWLNSYISAIANGGTIYQPQVAAKVIKPDHEPITVFEPKVVGTLPFSQEVINEIRDDMRETIISGTARLLQDLPVQAAAKTGTAEVIKGRQINSLFTVFAPTQNPTISMTILVEGSASNQGYAIRAANEVLKWYFAQPLP